MADHERTLWSCMSIHTCTACAQSIVVHNAAASEHNTVHQRAISHSTFLLTDHEMPANALVYTRLPAIATPIPTHQTVRTQSANLDDKLECVCVCVAGGK